MGNCGSNAKKKVPKRTRRNVISILLLGVSGCGKSTFAKQMKILHMNGFADFEIENYRKIIVKNLANGLHELVNLIGDMDELEEDNIEVYELFADNPTVSFDEDTIEMASGLWMDSAVQRTWNDMKFKMHYANLEYYMEHIDRITDPEYVPEHEEIIRSRQYTIGASETSFYLEKNWWTLIDVGGQTPERAKWTAIVQDKEIHALIYFSALDDFLTPEDNNSKVSRFETSIEIWKDVTTSGHFPRQKTILFLNKIDLFTQLISNKRSFKKFKKHFKTYKGKQNIDDTIEHIKELYIEVSSDPHSDDNEEIYIHTTCAIDTTQIDVIWNTIRKSIIEQRTNIAGIYI